ncbi:hypothetical protein MNEG_8815 [Monoraphidium neglectum]|jgi:hypothetical protein|uniref:Uncharacterized protein n=1 Tax=Monoraphidium neglectum TaxID=145388 RepID=A0A0D2JIL8_9CHLO|nr:hypothetical protein MNEG_8815 [Monoraphidium neglectum]KIY99147.1 hypothetical protein MNEG_8815 [Monoraphidium neglectum]|eukprot:XP_013898167.1 hypothetical protein MNEG_8815 [Monoraphidium neglectum]
MGIDAPLLATQDVELQATAGLDVMLADALARLSNHTALHATQVRCLQVRAPRTCTVRWTRGNAMQQQVLRQQHAYGKIPLRCGPALDDPETPVSRQQELATMLPTDLLLGGKR